MIHAFLFDLGNVLLHFSHERMCTQIAAVCGLPTPTIRHMLFDEGLQLRYESGEISTQQLHELLEQRCGQPIDPEKLMQAGCDIFWPNDSMLPVVLALKQQGFPLVLLSNVNEAHYAWVQQRFAVLEHFSHHALSYEVCACKPSPKIFEAAVRLAGVAPEACFYTDDVAAYVEAARKLGIDAVQYMGTEALVGRLKQRGIEI